MTDIPKLPEGHIKANKAVQLLAANTVTELNRLMQGMGAIAFESHPEIDPTAYDFHIPTATFIPRPADAPQ